MSIGKDRVLLRWGAGVGVAIVLVALLFLLRPASKAEAVRLAPQDIDEKALALGRVLGSRPASLAFTRAGRIRRFMVEEGAVVKQEAVLVELENDSEKNALDRAVARLAAARLELNRLATVQTEEARQLSLQAKAQAEYARRFFESQSELYAKKAISDLQFETARRDRDVALAQERQAETRLQGVRGVDKGLLQSAVVQAELEAGRARIDWEQTQLRAPADGTIIGRNLQPGDYLRVGEPVLRFMPTVSSALVEINADESEFGRIRVDQEARIRLQAYPEQEFSARVSRIGATVDEQRGTFRVELEMAKTPKSFLPDATVNVTILSGRLEKVLVLENRFLIRNGRSVAVDRLNQGRRERVPVDIHDLYDGRVWVRSGLAVGDVVLLPGEGKPGQRVRPVLKGE